VTFAAYPVRLVNILITIKFEIDTVAFQVGLKAWMLICLLSVDIGQFSGFQMS
jgi:hypothetical protein